MKGIQVRHGTQRGLIACLIKPLPGIWLIPIDIQKCTQLVYLMLHLANYM